MKRILFLSFMIMFLTSTGYSQSSKEASKYITNQLIKNIHLGWDVDNGNGYKWSNFAVGSGFSGKFEDLPKAFWYVHGDLSWSTYKLYKDGIYNNPDRYPYDVYVKTFSFVFPAVVGYRIYDSPLRAFGVKVYTGPILETILSGKQDGSNLPSSTGLNYYPFQFGWTIGTGVKILYLFGFNIAYRYYPTPVLNNGNLVRSSVNFTLGF